MTDSKQVCNLPGRENEGGNLMGEMKMAEYIRRDGVLLAVAFRHMLGMTESYRRSRATFAAKARRRKRDA